MNIKQTLRWTMVLMLIVVLNNCSEAPQNPTRQLTAEQKQELDRLTAQLLTSMHETDFFNSKTHGFGNPLEHATVSDFILRISNESNTATIQKILKHPIFAVSGYDELVVARTKDEDVQISQAAQDVLTNLAKEINGHLDDFFNSTDTLNFNAAALAADLATIIDNAESNARTRIEFSDQEMTAILAAFQVERELMPSIIENANSMFNATSGGRTKGFFKKLGRYVGSVVVSIAGGALVGGVIGAIAGNSPGAAIGAVIGGAVGGVIGIYQATQDRCASDWNFQTRIPFVHWVPC